MMKLVVLVSVLGTSTLLQARGDFRSPLSVERGYLHWQLSRTQDAWWYPHMNDEVKYKCWYVESWVSSFVRHADQAYIKHSGENKNTTDTLPLANLFLGKASFVGEEAFVDATISPELITENPFLGFSAISPLFDYNEKGVMWGTRFQYNFSEDSMWHIGGRVSLPFKIIEMEMDNGAALEESISDAIKTNILIDPTTGTRTREGSIRLDLLNSLSLNGTKLLQAEVDPISGISFLQVGDNTISGASSAAVPVYAITADPNQGPARPFAKQAAQVNTALPAAGATGTGGALFFFQNGTDYAGNLLVDRAAQRNLFVVPRAEDTNPNLLTEAAQSVQDSIFNALAEFDVLGVTALDFFGDAGLLFTAPQDKIGLGDLNAEFYFGIGDHFEWFVDGIVGVKAPTGTKRKKDRPFYVFELQTGNNRHWEMSVGAEGGWRPFNFFAFKLGYIFHHAFKRSELMPATLRGATVASVGPLVEGDVSWHYHTANIDVNFFHPYNPDLGVMFGYELYAKQKDKVSFNVTTVTDLLGTTAQTVDNTLSEARTNAMLHKIRGEIFHRWNYFEVFAGGSHAVAGRAAMKETEGHIGFTIYF